VDNEVRFFENGGPVRNGSAAEEHVDRMPSPPPHSKQLNSLQQQLPPEEVPERRFEDPADADDNEEVQSQVINNYFI
jgi:hypothetical protein